MELLKNTSNFKTASLLKVGTVIFVRTWIQIYRLRIANVQSRRILKRSYLQTEAAFTGNRRN